jgi:hypothetical protein
MARSDEENAHLDTMEDALGSKIADRDAFMTAFRGLVSCCGESEEEDGEEKGQGKGLPGLAIVLGKSKGK